MPHLDRFRAYFVLMNASFFIQLLHVTRKFVEYSTGTDIPLGPIKGVVVALAMFGVFTPAILIFTRFMRDEFAEVLWQRAAGTVLRALILLPIPAIFFIALSGQLGNYVLRSNVTSLTDASMIGAVRTVATLWLLTPVLFTFAFQWHRWRASA
jgi:hypothetical protein